MRRILLFKQLALAAALTVPLAGNGQQLLNEDFAYPVGNLVGQGGWVEAASGTALTLVENSLVYDNVEPTGGAVAFTNKGQDACHAFDKITSGNVYVSALINLSDVAGTNTFLTFAAEKMASSDFRGKLFAQEIANDAGAKKFLLGVSRKNTAKANISWGTTEYELNSTLLVVLKYTFNPGDNDDLVSLFVNPDTQATEPTPNAISIDDGISDTDAAEISNICIYQPSGNFGSPTGPTGIIDAIRVSTTWEGLFGGTASDKPSITATVGDPLQEYLFTGLDYHVTVNVKAQSITDDITVTSDNPQVTADVNSIPADQAISGTQLNLTVSPTTAGDGMVANVTLASGDTQTSLQFKWSALEATQYTDISSLRKAFAGLQAEAMSDGYVMFTGKAIVTLTYTGEYDEQCFYLQDETGGMLIYDMGGLRSSYQVGDELQNIVGMMYRDGLNVLQFMPASDFGAPLSQGNEVQPIAVTLQALKDNPAEYESRLVQVAGVTLESATGGDTFSTFSSVHIYQGENRATLDVMAGTDLVGQKIPTGEVTLTGVSTMPSGLVIAPRSMNDIEGGQGGEDPDPEPGTDPDEPGNEVEVGDNLFLDPSFENAKSNFLGASWEDWETISQGSIEENIKLSGDKAVRITSQGNAVISQVISYANHTFTPGEAYALTINYHVVTSQGNDDIQLDCSWTSSMNEIDDPNADVLKPSFTGTLNTWEKKVIRTIVPEGERINFQFGLKVPSGAEVIFDDFSFRKLESITTGIATPADNGLVTWSESGMLYLGSDRAQTVNVYSLNGVLVNRANLSAGVNTLALPAGAYLLQGGNGVQKVLVK